jgi:hypothetical protein
MAGISWAHTIGRSFGIMLAHKIYLHFLINLQNWKLAPTCRSIQKQKL